CTPRTSSTPPSTSGCAAPATMTAPCGWASPSSRRRPWATSSTSRCPRWGSRSPRGTPAVSWSRPSRSATSTHLSAGRSWPATRPSTRRPSSSTTTRTPRAGSSRSCPTTRVPSTACSTPRPTSRASP
ncbi:MAG: Glycine cleavage system H protein, partial [uncultured Nocardioides sp.]